MNVHIIASDIWHKDAVDNGCIYLAVKFKNA